MSESSESALRASDVALLASVPLAAIGAWSLYETWRRRAPHPAPPPSVTPPGEDTTILSKTLDTATGAVQRFKPLSRSGADVGPGWDGGPPRRHAY
jgi:hypothetical protein